MDVAVIWCLCQLRGGGKDFQGSTPMVRAEARNDDTVRGRTIGARPTAFLASSSRSPASRPAGTNAPRHQKRAEGVALWMVGETGEHLVVRMAVKKG